MNLHTPAKAQPDDLALDSQRVLAACEAIEQLAQRLAEDFECAVFRETRAIRKALGGTPAEQSEESFHER